MVVPNIYKRQPFVGRNLLKLNVPKNATTGCLMESTNVAKRESCVAFKKRVFKWILLSWESLEKQITVDSFKYSHWHYRWMAQMMIKSTASRPVNHANRVQRNSRIGILEELNLGNPFKLTEDAGVNNSAPGELTINVGSKIDSGIDIV